MNNESKFRTNGASGAILDEYEKSINELISVISNISDDQLIKIMDTETTNEECKSIQTILSHIVQSGYTYAIEVRRWMGEDIFYKEVQLLPSSNEYALALIEMFAYNEKLFNDYPNLVLEEYDPSKKIKVRWGQSYDVEQLFEHAIVHVLRHRRQIEKFISEF